jgi:predicted nicotinamide N-methyase
MHFCQGMSNFQPKEEEEDEENLSAIGFMFDASHEKFSTAFDIGENVSIVVRNIGDCPGHKQSGQYLWPAAKGLSVYLFEQKYLVENESVVELGAGCGLAGLVAAKLGAKSVIFTDYDYGSLNLIDESMNLNDLKQNCSTIFLEWGNIANAKQIGDITLAIGSDLIYCKDVVVPLFTTIATFLSTAGSKFILATSFELGEVSVLLLTLYSMQ